MHTYRITISIVIFLLAGCEPDRTKELEAQNLRLLNSGSALQVEVNRLSENNKELFEKANSQYYKRMAELTQKSNAAGISNGCRLFFQVCPDSITSEGDLAIAEGISGSTSWMYFAIVIFKLIWPLIVLPLIINLAYQKYKGNKLRPIFQTNLAAEKNVAEMKINLPIHKEEHDLVSHHLDDLQQKVFNENNTLNAVRDDIKSQLKVLEKLKQEQAELVATNNALKGFKF